MLRLRSVRPISRAARFSFLVLCAGGLCLSAAAKTKKHSASATPTPEEKEDLGLKNIPLTVGHEAKGLTLPNYDDQGHLLGRFQAATANRIDDGHVEFTNLRMQTYNAQQQPDFNITMAQAVLNLDTRVLESPTRTKIKRADFELAGDTMHFNTTTHQGTLKGHVHMTVFDRSAIAGSPKPKPGASPSTSPAATPNQP
jgi:lipopolysaccharide export system protein LptC